MNVRMLETIPVMRNRLFNDALLWIGIAAIPSVALSVSRAMVIGWKLVMYWHLLALCALWWLWLRRASIAYRQRVFGLLAINWLTTFSGLLNLGPASESSLYIILFAFIAALFIGGKQAWWLIAGNTLSLLLVGLAASMHWLKFELDYQVYAYHPLMWLSRIWNLSAYSVITALFAWRMLQELIDREAETQNLLLSQRKISANVPGVIYQFLLRPDGSSCFPYSSEGTQRLFGISAEQLNEDATFAFSLLHPEDSRRVQETVLRSARELSTIDETFRINHPQQGVVWIERNSTPERLPNGDTLWHGYMRDITGLKIAEQRLSATLESAPNIAVQWYDAQGQLLYWNRASELLFGWNRKEVLGKTLDQLIFSAAQAKAFASLLADISISGKVSGPSDYVVQHRDGHELVISSTIFTIPGELDPIFVCFDVDVTQRNKAENHVTQLSAEITRQLESTEQQREQLKTLLSAIPDLVWMKDPQGAYLFCNTAFEKLIGVAEPDLLGKTDFDFFPGAIAETFQADDRVAASSVTPVSSESRVTFASDGREALLETLKSAVRSRDGKLSGVLGIARDVTRVRNLLVEVEQSRLEATQSNEAKSMFLASMSHELRTPLNAIIGFAQMLDMGVPVPLAPRQQEPVRHILASGRHLLELINEVLDLTRIEAGKLTLSITTIEVAPLIEEAIMLNQSAATARRITLRHTCPAAINVLADSARVRQILLNLLSNAVKYNRDDGIIVVSCQNKNNQVLISVSDTGAGITLEQQAKLFQPFQRLGAEQTATEGTGIGLVICKKLAEAMQGQIGLESRVGIGSRFWVELPAANALSIQEHNLPFAASDSSISLVQGRVLYVEDSPVNVSVMEHAFSRFKDVELCITDTAEAGLALMQTRRFNLVLMDVNLPGMNGLKALQAIKANPDTADIPVIAVSAAALPQDVSRGLEAGFRDYLTKPFDVAELLEIVQNILEIPA